MKSALGIALIAGAAMLAGCAATSATQASLSNTSWTRWRFALSPARRWRWLAMRVFTPGNAASRDVVRQA